MSNDPVRIAMLGDSLTEGWGLRPEEALPVVLEELLEEAGVPARVLNFGTSGETASEGLERLDRVLKAEPHGLILEFGANDFFLGLEPERTRAAMRAMLDKAAERGLPVLVVGIRALDDLGLDPDYLRKFNAIFSDLAREFGALYFEDILACFHGDPDLVLLDGVHPNPAGVNKAARALEPLVRELAERAEQAKEAFHGA